MNYKKFQTSFFVIVLVGSLLLTLLVFRSYLIALAFGGVLAVVTRPVFKYLIKLLRSPAAAAFLTVVLATTTLLVPIVYFLAALASESGSLIRGVQSFFDPAALAAFLDKTLPPSLHAQVPALTGEVMLLAKTTLESLSADIVGFFSNVMGVFLDVLVMLFSAYYILKDGSHIKRELLFLSPLSDTDDEHIFQRLIQSVTAVMNGLLVVGIFKGILASLAFWAFSVPAPMFWGAMTGLASLIPFIGSGLVTVPAVLYLFIIGKTTASIGLLIFSVAIIGTIDNFLTPILVQHKTDTHPLLILLAIVGGIEFYGFAGFILGPLTIAVTLALIDIYRKEFKRTIERPAAPATG